jgi:hypothetical protein
LTAIRVGEDRANETVSARKNSFAERADDGIFSQFSI